jgi:hypothetical protein
VVPLVQAQTLTKILFLPLLLTALAPAQSSSTPAAPQLSPQAAYDQAMHPLEITRSAMGNWSDAELKALAIAVKQASEACGARTLEQFTRDDLIAYTRLCALGQQWPTVIIAANRYINSADPAKPQLANAYAFQINASEHTNDPKAILAGSLAMLKAVPYTSLTDETMYGALHYLQLAFTLKPLLSMLPANPSCSPLCTLLNHPRHPDPQANLPFRSTLSTPMDSPSPHSSNSPETLPPPKPSLNSTPHFPPHCRPTNRFPSTKVAASMLFSASICRPFRSPSLCSPSTKPRTSTQTTATPLPSFSSPNGVRSVSA